jgi:hypothetical protein
MLRNTFALLSGLFAMMIVGTVLAIANARLVYPPPPGFDAGQVAQANAFVAGMPVAALALLLLQFLAGAFVGAWVAARLAGSHRTVLAVVVGVLMSLGVAQSAMAVVHPTWLVAAGVGLPPVLAWVAAWLAQRQPADQNGLASTR